MKPYAKFQILSLVAGFYLAGCVTGSSRHPSSVEKAEIMVNPENKKTFLQEFDAAEPGVDSSYILNPKFRIGVFYRWMRAHPEAAVRSIQSFSPILELGEVAGRNGKQKLFAIVDPKDVRFALKNSGRFSSEFYFRKSAPFIVTPETQPSTPALKYVMNAIEKVDKTSLSATVASLAESTFQAKSYVGKNFKGQIFGRLDLVNHFGRRVPALVNEKYLGLVGFEERAVIELSQALQKDLIYNVESNVLSAEKSQEAFSAMEKYLDAVLAGEIKPPSNSLLGLVLAEAIKSQLNLDQLPKAEKVNLTRMFASLIAGIENSQTALAQVLDELFERNLIAKAQELVSQKDENGLRALIYEALRFNPIQSFVYRTVDQTTKLPSGLQIPQGALVAVVTAAAHFDENEFDAPYEFKLDRNLDKYLHFKNSGVRQLRDSLTEIEVTEMLKVILKLPGLRRAEGVAGQLDYRRIAKYGKVKELYSYFFPEKFAIEWNAPSLRDQVEISNKYFPYEEYLRQFNRDNYRACLANISDPEDPSVAPGFVVSAFSKNIKINKQNRREQNKHLLFCRLDAKFRNCISSKKIDILDEDTKAHKTAYESCRSTLTQTQRHFYQNVFFDDPLDYENISKSEVNSPLPDKYAFEDDLIFYDRYRLRESLMNPFGNKFLADKILFYVRLNIDFRMCVGFKAVIYEKTFGLAGKPVAQMYDDCKNGVLDPVTFKKTGALTVREKYLYEKIMLGRNVTYGDVEKRERDVQ